jgi:CheY-like chemotaxis protein
MKKIMMCDDDRSVRGLFQKILEGMGYWVTVAESGSEALQVLSRELPDLVLLDIMMEPMDGWEVLCRIREDERTKDVPVIVFTGKMPLPEEIARYGKLLHGFAMKPLRRKAFEDIVTGYFREEDNIAAFCEKALDSGADEEAVSEYATLRNNVRVLGEMFTYIEKIIISNQKPGDDNIRELLKIRELLEEKEKRLHELGVILKRISGEHISSHNSGE